MKKASGFMAMLMVCLAFMAILPSNRLLAQARTTQTALNKSELIQLEPGEPGPVVPLEPVDFGLTLSSYSQTYAGDTFSGSFKVFCSKSWTVSVANASWLHLNKTSGSGNGTVSFTLEPNFSGSTRTAKINVRMTGSNVAARTFTVTHKSKTLSISLSRTSIKTDFQRGYIDVIVDSNVPWTCEVANASHGDTSWISLSRTAGSAGQTKVTLYISENTTGYPRIATIKFSGTGIGIGISEELRVTQDLTYEDAPDIYIGYLTQRENEFSLNKFNEQAVDRVVNIYDNYTVHYDSYIIVQFKDDPYSQSLGHSHNVTSSQFVVDYAHSSRPSNKWWCTSDGRHTLKCHFAYPPSGTPVLEIAYGYYTYRIHFTNFTMTEGPWWMRAINTGDPWAGNGTHTGSQGSDSSNWPNVPSGYWYCINCTDWIPNTYSTCSACGASTTWQCRNCGLWNSHDSTKCYICQATKPW